VLQLFASSSTTEVSARERCYYGAIN